MMAGVLCQTADSAMALSTTIAAEQPLPEGWEMRVSPGDGRVFFVDHISHQTSWIDPRDKCTKPATFADCVGDELPYGWEQVQDDRAGTYYINHLTGVNQVDDPRDQWRAVQDSMIRQYMNAVTNDIDLTRESQNVVETELSRAESSNIGTSAEYIDSAVASRQGLSLSGSSDMDKTRGSTSVVAHDMRDSQGSLCSLASSSSSRHDPDSIRSEIEAIRRRVHRLKHEPKLPEQRKPSSESSTAAAPKVRQLNDELTQARLCYQAGEKERLDLLKEVERLKEEVLRSPQQETAEPSTATHALDQTAGQTSSSSLQETSPNEVSRARLQHSELKKRLRAAQNSIAEIDEQLDSEHAKDDYLSLTREKEKLLVDLIGVSKEEHLKPAERDKVLDRIAKLHTDLQKVRQSSDQEILLRTELLDRRAALLRHIDELHLDITSVENVLRSLSVSTLSHSANSLSAHSSQASITSLPLKSVGLQPAEMTVHMQTLMSRLEHLLAYEPPPCFPTHAQSSAMSMQCLNNKPNTSGISSFPSAPEIAQRPSEDEIRPSTSRPRWLKAASVSAAGEDGSFDISSLLQTASGTKTSGQVSILEQLCRSRDLQPSLAAALNSVNRVQSSRSEQQSGQSSAHSVSAAVSDESVAGDSGVYDADAVAFGDRRPQRPATPQILLTLSYDESDRALVVGVERARNLTALFTNPILPQVQDMFICVKGALLPDQTSMFETSWNSECCKPVFKQTFSMPVGHEQLHSKSLQLNIWCTHANGNDNQKCLASHTISLADLDNRISTKWYNVLSFKFMQPICDVPAPSTSDAASSSRVGASLLQEVASRLRGQPKPFNKQDTTFVQKRNETESSDDSSTVISSQASTLTRQTCAPTADDPQDGAAVARRNKSPGITNILIREPPSLGCVVEEPKTASVDDSTHDDSRSNTLRASQPDTARSQSLLGGTGIVCKLNRSDSDSSVPLRGVHIRNTHSIAIDSVSDLPFKRHVDQRRSLRQRPLLKQRALGNYVSAIRSRAQQRTPATEIESDLVSTKIHIARQQEEIQRLKNFKSVLETGHDCCEQNDERPCSKACGEGRVSRREGRKTRYTPNTTAFRRKVEAQCGSSTVSVNPQPRATEEGKENVVTRC